MTDTDINAAFGIWLLQPGLRQRDMTAEDSAGDLIEIFGHDPTPARLVDIILGDLHTVVSSRLLLATDAEREAAKLRKQGREVRLEEVPDLAVGVPRKRLVIVRRRPNLAEICEWQSVHRRSITANLEQACRELRVDGDAPARMKAGREIFMHCFVYGQPPDPPSAAVPCDSATAGADTLPAVEGAAPEMSAEELARRLSFILDGPVALPPAADGIGDLLTQLDAS
jgi:hypothetical protein